MSKISRLIIFDLDNTLYDDVGAVKKALSTLKSENQSLSGIALDDLFKKYYTLESNIRERYMNGELNIDQIGPERMREFLSEIGVQASEDDVHAMYERFNYLHIHYGRAFRGVKGLLNRLKKDHMIGIITNHVGDLQYRKIEKMGIGKYLDFVIAAYDIKIFKPDPRIFLLALGHAGVGHDDAVVVGDSWKHDILGAQSASLRAVWLNRRKIENPDPGVAAEIRTLVPIDAAERAILQEFSKYYPEKDVSSICLKDVTEA